MDKTAFLASVEELFETDEGSLTGTEQVVEVPGWCSLIFVGMIAMIDEQYEVALPPESLLNDQTLDGLFELISSTKAEQDRAAA